MPIHDWTRVDAGIFHHFHHNWITQIGGALNAGLLPRDFYALAEQIADRLEPDVLALERQAPGGQRHAPGGNGQRPAAGESSHRGGIALATTPPKVRFTAEAQSERYARKRKRLAVRHISGDQVVALVEIVSPGNKDRASALNDFVEKAIHFLEAGVHLLVIDILPPTPRDPEGIHRAIWSQIMEDQYQRPADEPLTLAAYAGGGVKRAFVESAAVGQSLPDMPLFLEPELYVPVPLEATYVAAYDGVPERWREVLDAPAE